MCGIAGIAWKTDPIDNHLQVVTRMCDAIAHRGPDSDGMIDGSVATVGFKRLAIIDVENGTQPIPNESGSVECILNGEIYNHRELRRSLERRGHRMRSRSDAEILPHLYEEHGHGLFELLNGMFAIVVVDHEAHRVILARDHFGIKQLYYAETSEGIVFGSEMKAMIASGLVACDVREKAIGELLSLLYVPHDRTPLEAVWKLPAGEYLVIENGSYRRAKFFDARSLAKNVGGRDVSEREIRDRILMAVERQLQADVPVGISLSGGLDSVAILIAAKEVGSNPFALTVVWDDDTREEAEHARLIANHLGIEHEILDESKNVSFDDFEMIAWLADEPICDPALLSQYRVASAARKRVKVLLSGAGGDEIFGGYGRYRKSRRQELVGMVPRQFRGTIGSRLYGADWTRELEDAISDVPNSRALWHSYNMNNLRSKEGMVIHRALDVDIISYFQQQFATFAHVDVQTQQLFVDLISYLPHQVLPMLDRATMAASIEGRVPLLDIELVHALSEVPGPVRIGKRGESKPLLRRFVEESVPRELLLREKRGFGSAFSAANLIRKEDELRKAISRINGRSLVDPQKISALIASPRHVRRNAASIYVLLLVDAWLRLLKKHPVRTESELEAMRLLQRDD